VLTGSVDEPFVIVLHGLPLIMCGTALITYCFKTIKKKSKFPLGEGQKIFMWFLIIINHGGKTKQFSPQMAREIFTN